MGVLRGVRSEECCTISCGVVGTYLTSLSLLLVLRRASCQGFHRRLLAQDGVNRQKDVASAVNKIF